MNTVLGLRTAIKTNAFKLLNQGKQKYECPICNYYGPFIDINPPTGSRKNASCPKCSSLERHRLQKLVINIILEKYDFSSKKMLHFAPESFFQTIFKSQFKDYVTIDLYMKNVDVKADITNLPFKDAEYDFIFASHVLEHIEDDMLALSEIRRVLKPKGIAILPVPIVSKLTIEYPEANPFEENHFRSPGFDYYERYSKYFSFIENYSSDDFSNRYQLFVYENRVNFPNKECPLRQPMIGEKHSEIVPVCFA